MLAASGEIASYPTKVLRAFESAKAEGDLLLDFGHAQIVFTLVVGEWHELIGHESQRFGFEVTEPFKKIS